MSDIIEVHGIDCEVGCWVDGHWGQYGPDHLADKVDIEGWDVFDSWRDDPRILREISDELESMGYSDAAFAIYEWRVDATDKIVAFLNEGTPEGYVWDWFGGEFFLSVLCDDEENCTDETCAHWAYC